MRSMSKLRFQRILWTGLGEKEHLSWCASIEKSILKMKNESYYRFLIIVYCRSNSRFS